MSGEEPRSYHLIGRWSFWKMKKLFLCATCLLGVVENSTKEVKVKVMKKKTVIVGTWERWKGLNDWTFDLAGASMDCCCMNEEYFQLGSMIWDTSVGGLVLVSWWCERDQVDLYWPRGEYWAMAWSDSKLDSSSVERSSGYSFQLYIWSSDQFWLWNWELILKKWMIQHFQIVVELPMKVNVLTIE